jgi:uncharacterized protein involved in outer membrane biogenesis
MKRWLTILLVLLAIAVGLMAAGGLVVRSFLSGERKDQLVSMLGERMGAPVSVTSVGADLSQWLRFRPAIALEGVVVGNPPGFKSKNVFEAKAISVRVSLAGLLSKNIQVQSIRIEQPQITVETNSHGVTNIGALMKKVSEGSGSKSTSSSSSLRLAIDELAIKGGTLTMADAQNLNVHGIDVTLQNFSADRKCHLVAAASFFAGTNSGLKLDAQAGPFGADSLPLDGTLAIHIAPNEIPAELRKEQFGNLLGAPGDKSRVALEATVRGDLYGTLAGPAKLTLAAIQIGKDSAHLLPLSGEAQSSMTASGLIATPSFALDVPSAKLDFGKGEWNGSAKVQMQGAVSTGSSHGSIHGVDINQMLESFTTTRDKLYGKLALPSYAMQFSGRNAAEIRNSLRVTGKLSVTDGRVAAMDFVATLQRALGQTQQDTDATKGATPFHSLTADLNIAQARMDIANLVLDGPALKANGSGTIGFDQSLKFDLTAHVTGTLANLFNTISLNPGASEADVPVSITGTVDSPRVRPQMRKMAGGAVKGLINSFLNRKK